MHWSELQTFCVHLHRLGVEIAELAEHVMDFEKHLLLLFLPLDEGKLIRRNLDAPGLLC